MSRRKTITICDQYEWWLRYYVFEAFTKWQRSGYRSVVAHRKWLAERERLMKYKLEIKL